MLVFGLGLAIALFNTQAIDSAGYQADLLAHLGRAYGGALWTWLLRGTGVVIGLSALCGVGQALLSVRRVAGPEPHAPVMQEGLRAAVQEVASRVEASVTGESPNVITALNDLIRGAIALSASDIHLTPGAREVKLTYRVHGSLYDVVRLPAAISPLLTTRIKVLARLDTYVRGTPQDGRLVMDLDGGSIEARVSTLPTENGERVVLRLVRGSRAVPDLDALGFSEEVLLGVRRALARPQGLLFVTGPVGSGKTTTLYSAMKHIAAGRGSTTTLVTLEDPIELELTFATQTQMHPKAGMTFASVLRSVLRQDPNVLMVGEIRDRETADITLQAGLTGHLIITTVHGDSAAGSFARLMDMGIEPYVLASAAAGSLSQRLVRTLCTACRRETEPEKLHVEAFGQAGVVLPPGPYYEPIGCDFCEHAGYTGRVPIAEFLEVDSRIREEISDRQATRDIEAVAVTQGMTTLLRDGLRLARAGETSLSEVLRVTR